ncbi:hypothetical protein HPB51_005281 [Rhipicephalus microplus]|uniref:Uncharacterized protein n=1 Tax=Rhipicephalus microplus TaxID=6941 RepID=A0A9J6DFV1_RHIMP|nr:hypothetical protein HPB51_005281 [Rhipicephalus microplus]
MSPYHTHLLDNEARLLRSVLRDPPSDQSWARCEDTWNQAVALAAKAVWLPRVCGGRERRQPNPAKLVEIQRLYRRNQRRAADSTFLLRRTITSIPAPAGLNVMPFSPKKVFLRLRKSENTGPRSNRLTYCCSLEGRAEPEWP